MGKEDDVFSLSTVGGASTNSVYSFDPPGIITNCGCMTTSGIFYYSDCRRQVSSAIDVSWWGTPFSQLPNSSQRRSIGLRSVRCSGQASRWTHCHHAKPWWLSQHGRWYCYLKINMGPSRKTTTTLEAHSYPKWCITSWC